MKKLSFLMAVILMFTGSVFAFDVSADEVPATESVSAYTTSNKWIWSSSTVTKNSISYFRHDYDLDAAPVSMKVRVSAHNHLKFYVNGNIVTGYVTPAPASVPENIYYLDYEFTGDKLAALLGSAPTKLALAAEVQYMGCSGGNYINAKPGLFAEVTLTYSDNSSETLYTDTTWRALSDTPFVNGLSPMSTRNMNMQLDYDARKMPDKLAWTKYGYDESTYTAGTWTNAVAADASTANYKMRHQAIPEGVIHESITPVAVGYQQTGHQVFDAGRIVSGFVGFKLSAPAGTKVTIRYGENIDGSGKVIHRVADETNENYFDAYTFSGNGVEEFVADFDYKAFRYFEIVGMPTDVSASDFTVEWASTGVEHTASFTSSNNALNKIYEACVNTQINNILGMPTDCPHREQSQYIADSQIQYDFISYGFSHASDLMYKTLLDFASQQFDIGIFSFIAPAAGYAGLNSLHIPEWDLRYADILLTYYKTTGDLVGTREFYDNAVANAEYWAKGMDESGLVRQDYGVALWHISDHPGPQVAHTGDYYTVQNLLMYDTFNDISKIAAILGKTEDSELYATKAASLKAAINANLFNEETGLYLDSSEATASNPGVTSMAINVGVSPDYLIPAQLDYIAESAHTTNVVLTWEVFNALLNYGAAEEKQEVYDRIIEIYTKMGESGTVWEGVWNTNASHSHAWNAFPAKMLHSDFLGVKFAGVEYEDIEIKPYLPTNLASMSGSLKLPETRGDVEVSLSRANNILTVAVDTPESALIAVPRVGSGSTLIKAGDTVIFENGAGKSASGLAYVNNDAEYVYFNANAGTYSITSESVMSSASEFAVDVSTTVGGKITVNGGADIKEYSNTHSLNSVLTIVAKPDAGYKFTGFSGSHGSTDATLKLAVTSAVDLTANFERHDDIVRYVHIDAPIDGGFKVDFAGKTVEVPGVIEVLATEDAVITVTESADSNFEFAAWSGDIYSAKKIITIEAGEDEVNLAILPSFKGIAPVADDEDGDPVNIALGATVTTNNEYTEGKWSVRHLTDGFKLKNEVSGKLGFTSNSYGSNKDISANPHELEIDLGSDMYVDTAIVYPRVDNKNVGDSSDCFPVDFKFYVKADGKTAYTLAATVTNQPNPYGTGATITFDKPLKGRYVKMVTTKLGDSPSDASWESRIQLAEIELFMNGEIPAEPENLALNSNVTTNNEYTEGKWSVRHLTDGFKLKNEVSGKLGFTSQNYASKDISATPHELEIDLGIDKYVDTAIVYPRVDNKAEGASSDCFPVDFKFYVKADGSEEYTLAATVTDQPNPYSTGATIEFDAPVKGRYVKMVTTKLGDSPSDATSENRIQLAEIELFMMSEVPDTSDRVLEINGNGSVIVNGEELTLPVLKAYEKGTKLAVVPTADTKFVFNKWTGDITSTQVPLYLTMDNDISIVANYSRSVFAVSDNLARTATASATAGQYETSGTTWRIENINDGNSTASGGFTSKAYSSDSALVSSGLYIEFDFAKNTDIGRVTLHPRKGVVGLNGGSASFPKAVKIQYCLDGSSTWIDAASFTAIENPAGQGVSLDFDPVNARYIRVVPTAMGDPTASESWENRIQFSEIEVYATNFMTENLAPNATSITATGDKYPIDNTNWKISYLVDGLTTKSGSVNGYTSGELKADTIATTPFTITFEFDEAITANEMVLYPRSDAKDASGKSPNFPLTYSVEAYNAATGEFETVFSVENADNPAGKPAYCLFNKTVTTTKLRYVATGVGTYPTDEQVYRAQFCEIKIGLVEADDVSGEVGITVAPAAGIVLVDADDVKSVSASATGAKENIFTFSVEDEMGLPADFAELKITGDASAEASVYGEGNGFVVVRLAENPQYSARVPLKSALVSYLVGDVDASGTVNIIDAIILSRNVANWVGYEDENIDSVAADIDFDGELTPADVTKLIRHLANWKGYETLPIID